MTDVQPNNYGFHHTFDFLDDDDCTAGGLSGSNNQSNGSNSPNRAYENSIFSPEVQPSNFGQQHMSAYFDQTPVQTSFYNFTGPAKTHYHIEPMFQNQSFVEYTSQTENKMEMKVPFGQRSFMPRRVDT